MQFKFLFSAIVVLLILSHTVFAQEHTYFVHGGTVRTVAYSPVNALLVASAGAGNTVKLWNLHNDTVTTLRGHTDIVNSVAFSPDGQLLASGSDDYTIKVWEVRQHSGIATFEHITDWTRSQIKAVAFSPDGRWLASAGWNVKLWDVQKREELATFAHDAWVWAVAFSSDGQWLATGTEDGTVNVWNPRTRRVVTTLEGDANAVFSVKFSPDNRILASSGYHGEIKLWAAREWTLLGTLRSTTGTVKEIAFSPDGTVLASTGHEIIDLWEVASGAHITSLQGHSGWVNAVAFSSDGTTLTSGGEDETLRLWDIAPYVEPQQFAARDRVRLVYFLPRGRSLQPNIWTKFDTLIRDVQRFYADEMEKHDFGRKTFTFETDANGETLVYRVDGQFRDRYYHTDTADKVLEELSAQFDMSKNVYLVAVDISSEVINDENICGVGGGNWYERETRQRESSGWALIPASGACFDGVHVTAHELGHAFGLDHDFRNDAYIMSYGAAPNQLAKCAAAWLDASRFFNIAPTSFNELTAIQMLASQNAQLQFEITDLDGLHHAQLIVPTTAGDPAPGGKLHECIRLNGFTNTIGFGYNGFGDEVTLQVIDVHGNITRQSYVIPGESPVLTQNPVDVNGDGTVDVTDLVLVAASFGETIPHGADPNPDVNRDGAVNVIDLLLVASQLNTAPAAPALHALTAAGLQRWINQAKNYHVRANASFLRANTVEKGIAVLEHLLAAMMPTETRLLANYPNPFNPETWIPYQLSEPADVTVSLHATDGKLVRRLALGYLPAGNYQNKSRAAYWDGKNAQGEPVASGVYFYTLKAGDFSATKKMLIRK